MAAAGEGHILHRCRTAHPWQMRAWQSQALSWPRTEALGVSAPRPLAGDSVQGHRSSRARGRCLAARPQLRVLAVFQPCQAGAQLPGSPAGTEGLCPQQGSGATQLRFPAPGLGLQHVASSSGSHRSYRLLWPAPALGTQLIFWYFHLKPQWGHGWKPLSLGWLPQRFLRPPFELWGSAAQPGPANLRHGSGADAGPQLLTDPAQPSANPWA